MTRGFRRPRRLNALFGSLAATASAMQVDGVAVLHEVATELYRSLDTPVSLSCEILLRYGELRQLLEKSVDALAYPDCDVTRRGGRLSMAERFATDYQAVNFLRKVPFTNVEGVDAEAAAKVKFAEAEQQCKETNARIRTFIDNPARASSTVRQASCLAISYIQEVLGYRVPFGEWIAGCKFGPGSFSHPDARGLTSIYDKLQVLPSVTKDFRDPGAVLVMSAPSWARSVTDCEDEGFWPFVRADDLTLCAGNRVTFVPKTATTERAIAIEPLVNVYAQLGLGKMIRRRLKAFAQVDLDDQTINQGLAQEGSMRGFLCTVDLSSASDTVAREVVRHLLPDAWYACLDVTRCKTGDLDGTYFQYEKFSSMGNGFTFELESLIFWALSRAACVVSESPEMVSVYGDDIVVPVSAYAALVEILTFFGFSLNKRKSFERGVFRESCGKDYYNGYEVRPFLQTEVPQDLCSILTLANGLRRAAHRRSRLPRGCDLRFRAAWRATCLRIPKSLRDNLAVPAHAGDADGLVSDWDWAQRSEFVTPHGGWQGFFGLRMTPHHDDVKEATNFLGGAASLLYRCRDGFEGEYSPASPTQGRDPAFVLRDGAFYGTWTELGPWI